MIVMPQNSVDRENRYGDHLSFSDAGYAAVRFTQSLEDSTRQHNDRDTIDGVQGLYLTRATQTVLTIVTALADGLRPPPANFALRDAGNGMRTLVWEPVPSASGYVVALRTPNSLTYQSFDITDAGANSVTWDRFTPDNFYSVSIAAKDASGLMGPLSPEFIIR
jgi:hypothetical protein